MPLQRTGLGGCGQFEGFEQVALFGGHSAGSGDGVLIDLHAVFLNALERGQCALDRECAAGASQSLAHHAMEQEC